jgi:hypothetical protein
VIDVAGDMLARERELGGVLLGADLCRLDGTGGERNGSERGE